MALLNMHPRAELLRYLDGAVTADERRTLEAHLASCRECRDYMARVKNFNEGLAGLTEEEFTSREPCPDSWTLASYDAGEVDEETARHLRAHLLYCDECAEEFDVLRRLTRGASWAELWETLKQAVVDLGKTYGPGALVGQIRIMAESPALAVRRGGGAAETRSKVLEVAVGENTYSIELGITPEGSLTCDIAGYETPKEVPVQISLRSEAGEELFSTKTDVHGNSHFVLPGDQVGDGVCILTLADEDNETHLPFRVPERRTSA